MMGKIRDKIRMDEVPPRACYLETSSWLKETGLTYRDMVSVDVITPLNSA